jgi:hypothetical protein
MLSAHEQVEAWSLANETGLDLADTESIPKKSGLWTGSCHADPDFCGDSSQMNLLSVSAADVVTC